MFKLRYKPLLKCDVLGIGNAVSGAAAAAGQIAASVYASDKQFEATRETNELNKQLAAEKNALDYQVFTEANEFNALESEKARDFSWQLQKDAQQYNSIGSQIERAKAAGINPAAVAGGAGTTAVAQGNVPLPASSANVPNFTAAQMQVPNLSALQDMSEAFANIGQSVESFARAGKAREETKSQQTYNKFAAQIHDAGLKFTNAQIRQCYAAAQQLDADASMLREKVSEVKMNVQLLQKQGNLVDEKTFNQQLKNAFDDATLVNRVDQIATLLDIDKNKARELQETFAARVYGVKLQNAKTFSEILDNASHAAFLDASTALVSTQNEGAAYNLQLDYLYSSDERKFGVESSKQTVNQLEWNNSIGVRLFNMLCQGAMSVGQLVGGVGVAGAAVKGAFKKK